MFHLDLFFHSTLFQVTTHVTQYRPSSLLLTAVYYSIILISHFIYYPFNIQVVFYSDNIYLLCIVVNFFRMCIQKRNYRVLLKNVSLPQSHKQHPVISFQEVQSLVVHISVFKSSGILFLYMFQGCMNFIFPSMEIQVLQLFLLTRLFLLLIHDVMPNTQQVFIYSQVYFQAFYSVKLFYLPINVLILHTIK